MNAVGVIPARFAASRFPGKPLAEILGKPMIQHVWEGCRGARHLSRVLIATDDEKIRAACEGFGAEVIMTRGDHPTGTDRIAEVAEGLSEEVIVNIQGDEPLINGAVIDAALDALEKDPEAPMATVVHEAEGITLADPNRVKVVMDQRGRALYFSRNTIPALGDPAHRVTYWQHVGIYAYRRPFLARFITLPRTPYEQAEALEQLRALEHGYPIAVGKISGWHSTPVDVPEDIATVEARLAKE